MRTIGPLAAAQLLGVVPGTVRYRAATGKLRVARCSPLRFRVIDILEARERGPVRDPRGKYAVPLNVVVEEALRASHHHSDADLIRLKHLKSLLRRVGHGRLRAA